MPTAAEPKGESEENAQNSDDEGKDLITKMNKL